MVTPRGKRSQAQGGMTLVELMVAIAMFATGLIGVLALMVAAISGNGRNKMDTSATMLAQMVADKIAAQPSAGGAFPLVDCNPGGATTWTIATTAGGANLDGNGDINWLDTYASVPANYKMLFVTCGANNDQITYEVRWNVQSVGGFSRMISVGARPTGAVTDNTLRFARPVTLRTTVTS
jgi:type II secretory pathway pseudopilin PulG